MDLGIQMRSLELLVKLMRHDYKDLPAYGYSLQKPPAAAAPVQAPFPRATPEAMGLSSTALERLFREFDAHSPELAIHSAMLLRHGHVVAEADWAPYSAALPHMLFSMSKSVAGTAVGIAVDEGLLDIGERVVDIFPEHASAAVMKAQQNLTVRHLLTMSTGNRFNEVGSMLDADWPKMFLQSVPRFEPGSAFDYNSLNSYMLAAVLRRRTGMPLSEYLGPRLFAPLGITSFHWERCPQDTEKGGWGLSLRLEDCAKLGQLYLQKGLWDGKRILSEAWVEAATSLQMESPAGEIKKGYGYQIWLLEDGDYLFNGAFGQFVLVMPKLDMVAAFTGGSPQFFAEGPLYPLLRAALWAAADAPLPESGREYARLRSTCASLVYAPALPDGLTASDAVQGADFEALCTLLEGKEYRFHGIPGCGLFPQALQSVHGNFSAGLDMLRFYREGEYLAVEFYEGFSKHRLRLGAAGFVRSAISQRGEQQHIGARLFAKKRAEGGYSMALMACFLETPYTRILSLRMDESGEQMQAVFLEAPDIMRTSEMLFDLISVSGEGYIKRLGALLRRMPGMSEEGAEELLRRFSRPGAEGGRIHDGEAERRAALPPPKLEA